MNLVVDANMIISALIKKGKVREIILSGKFKFVTPNFIKEEIYKYSEYIRSKAHLTKEEFDLLLALFFEEIEIISKDEYESELTRATKIMKNDVKDVTYVACYHALKCDGIWTKDQHYQNKQELKVVTTEYLLKLL